MVDSFLWGRGRRKGYAPFLLGPIFFFGLGLLGQLQPIHFVWKQIPRFGPFVYRPRPNAPTQMDYGSVFRPSRIRPDPFLAQIWGRFASTRTWPLLFARRRHQTLAHRPTAQAVQWGSSRRTAKGRTTPRPAPRRGSDAARGHSNSPLRRAHSSSPLRRRPACRDTGGGCTSAGNGDGADP